LLFLLEGIEIYDEDWDQIASHVGTKSREACVLKFLQLPIEEPYVDGATERAISASGIAPFAHADNPVLSVVAFLAGVVDVKVAAKAAGRGIEELKARLRAEANHEALPSSSATGTVGDDEEMSNLERAAATAIGSAATKAHLLADHTTLENGRLLNQVISLQLRKIETKLAQFDDLEAILEQERRELERTRQEVYCERLALRREVEKAAEAIRAAQAAGGRQGVEMLDKALADVGGDEMLEVTNDKEGEDVIEIGQGGEGMTA
jgi:SWI/SNF related-matrix-associated actin-dependent regulator of chromatin subfamily C